MRHNTTNDNHLPQSKISHWLQKQAVGLVINICILTIGHAVNSAPARGQVFINESTRSPLLIEGSSQCKQSSLIGSKPGSDIKFAVACVSDSAMFVWEVPVREANDRNEYISFAFASNTARVQLLCKCDSPGSLINTPKRSNLLLLEGKQSDVSPFAYPSVFSRFGIGIFLGSDDLGFNLDLLRDSLNRGETSIELPTGNLSLVTSGGSLQSIEFNQNSDSIFSTLDSKQTRVGEVTLPGSESGEVLSSRRFIVQFEKPISVPPTAPWSANTTIQYRGVTGGSASAEYAIKISSVHRDETRARTAIEEIKQLIPAGASIAPIDAVAKQWNDGRIVPVLDQNAIDAANSVAWGNPSTSYWPPLLLTVVCVVLGVAWFLRKRHLQTR